METVAHKTLREYFDDTYKFTSQGSVLAIQAPEAEGPPDVYRVILDKTIFHP